MATLIDELQIVADEGKLNGLRADVIRIKLKEKLQLYVLDFIYNSPKYNHLILYGGTCLRRCFNASRMSEDIDCETNRKFEKEKLAADLKKHFSKKVMYDDLAVYVPGRNISRVELRFPVLNRIGLSLHAAEKLNLKVEVNVIDREYSTELRTISEDRFSFVVRHYDLPTLMAGKMVACLERVWEKGKTGITIKGRDYFDLIWYMQRQIMPNIKRLADAKGKYTVESAFKKLAANISKITSRALLVDLEPLFEDSGFVNTWVSNFHDEFYRLLKNYIEIIPDNPDVA